MWTLAIFCNTSTSTSFFNYCYYYFLLSPTACRNSQARDWPWATAQWQCRSSTLEPPGNSLLSVLYLFIFVATLWHVELPGQRSDSSHSHKLSQNCSNTRPTTPGQGLNPHPSAPKTLSMLDPVAPQQEPLFLFWKVIEVSPEGSTTSALARWTCHEEQSPCSASPNRFHALQRPLFKWLFFRSNTGILADHSRFTLPLSCKSCYSISLASVSGPASPSSW